MRLNVGATRLWTAKRLTAAYAAMCRCVEEGEGEKEEAWDDIVHAQRTPSRDVVASVAAMAGFSACRREAKRKTV